MAILPVIMSGGAGTRLWPVSTDERPKQFHAFGPGGRLIQETAQRVRSDAFLPPLVICNAKHGRLAQQQLEEIGVQPAAIIEEPIGRNTCAVAVVAAAWAVRHAPNAEVLLMPADHVIVDIEGFQAKVLAALAATKDYIVTFGIHPTAPETGFGYIQGGAALYDGVQRVSRFVEKPERALAEQYLREGGYSWNAGLFLYRPDLFLEEARRLCPTIVATTVASLDGATSDGLRLLLSERLFESCPSEAVDVAIMEKTERAAVAPIDVGWADLGSWSELWRHSTHDVSGNAARGDVATLDTRQSLLWSEGPAISVIGLEDIMVIATADHVLVLPKARAQDVKKIVELRKAALKASRLKAPPEV